MHSSTHILGEDSFRPDRPSAFAIQGRRGADGRLRLHQDVLDRIRDRPRVGKRLAVVAQQMAALGRSTIVKGCSDSVNRGWRRTPLGGSGGMHFYLWWSPQGSRQTRKFKSLKRNAILIRTVRHHDDHRPLKVGRLGDYHTLEWKDLDDESNNCFETPWTETQRLFVLEDKPVRLVHGYPGSGKTTSLWKAVEARDVGRTLYLSWSRKLTEQARARFSAFAPPGSEIVARDFTTFLGDLSGTDVNRQSLARSRHAFREAFDWWKIADHQGPWTNKMDALHAELRATLFGCAVPGMFRCEDDGTRLSDEEYLSGRVSSVGQVAGRRALDLVRRSGWRRWYEDVFPEISAAKTARARLLQGDLPDMVSGFDRIVVDEVQDLTLLEAAVVVQYCHALASRRGHAPWLLMAFDDGQTVRPSGFHSGRLNKLLYELLTTPEEFNLEFNLRSPGPIARVIERASVLYTVIRKGSRPGDQRSDLLEQDESKGIGARLIYVEIQGEGEAKKLVTALAEVQDVAMVTPEATVPNWVPDDSQAAILTPEVAKGLEYASVCVLDAGEVLQRLRRSVDDQDPLETHQRRTAIDRLRVALSRATEKLVLVDVAPDDTARQLSLELLGSAERFTGSELLALFRDADAPLDERILTRTRDARDLVDLSPDRAWARALQAWHLLGGPGKRAALDDRSVQDEVCVTVLAVAARLLVDNGLDAARPDDVASTAENVVRELGRPGQADLVRHLAAWVVQRGGQPLDLLDAALALSESDREWLVTALPPIFRALQQALTSCASEPQWAPRFAGDVEGRLRLAGFIADVEAEAQRQRQLAVNALVGSDDDAAFQVMERMQSPDPRQLATLSERLGHHSRAAKAYEQAGMPVDALRNWRIAGEFDKAALHAKGKLKTDLMWMVRTEKLMQRRPKGIQDRLTPNERKRLSKAMRMPRRQKTLFD